MAIVIATRNQYILAKHIHSVVLTERFQTIEVNKNNKYYSIVLNTYEIQVIYTPDGPSSPQGRFDERADTSVTIIGKKNAYSVYGDLISQIREQCPDQLYLDKALERLLDEKNINKMNIEETEQEQILFKRIEKGLSYDRSARKIRKTGKTKRTSKKVLRGTKRGNRGRVNRNRR